MAKSLLWLNKNCITRRDARRDTVVLLWEKKQFLENSCQWKKIRQKTEEKMDWRYFGMDRAVKIDKVVCINEDSHWLHTVLLIANHPGWRKTTTNKLRHWGPTLNRVLGRIRFPSFPSSFCGSAAYHSLKIFEIGNSRELWQCMTLRRISLAFNVADTSNWWLGMCLFSAGKYKISNFSTKKYKIASVHNWSHWTS